MYLLFDVLFDCCIFSTPSLLSGSHPCDLKAPPPPWQDHPDHQVFRSSPSDRTTLSDPASHCVVHGPIPSRHVLCLISLGFCRPVAMYCLHLPGIPRLVNFSRGCLTAGDVRFGYFGPDHPPNYSTLPPVASLVIYWADCHCIVGHGIIIKSDCG